MIEKLYCTLNQDDIQKSLILFPEIAQIQKIVIKSCNLEKTPILSYLNIKEVAEFKEKYGFHVFKSVLESLSKQRIDAIINNMEF